MYINPWLKSIKGQSIDLAAHDRSLCLTVFWTEFLRSTSHDLGYASSSVHCCGYHHGTLLPCHFVRRKPKISLEKRTSVRP